MVDLALTSLALAVFSRTQHHPPAATEASSRYCHLLRVAQERIAQVTIPTCDERNIDACLLAVILMGRYEAAMYRPADLNSKDSLFTSQQIWSHHDGSMAILKVWNDNLSHNTRSCIVRETRRGLIRSSLLRNRPLPDWLLNGDRFGEHNLGLEYDRIVVRIVNLRYAFASFQPKHGLQAAKLVELNKEARELDRALQEWAANIPSTWSYHRHTLENPDAWPRRHFYSSIVYSHSSPGYVAVWSQYFGTRMLINSTRVRILELSSANPLLDFDCEQQRLECLTQLKAMADSLASTIPFCLDRFTVDNPNSPNCQPTITLNTNEEIKPSLASLAVWPLTIASSIEGIDVSQHLWFRSVLANLGRIVGDGIFEYVETDQWATL